MLPEDSIIGLMNWVCLKGLQLVIRDVFITVPKQVVNHVFIEDMTLSMDSKTAHWHHIFRNRHKGIH